MHIHTTMYTSIHVMVRLPLLAVVEPDTEAAARPASR